MGLGEEVLKSNKEAESVDANLEVVFDEEEEVRVGGDLVFELADVLEGVTVDVEEGGSKDSEGEGSGSFGADSGDASVPPSGEGQRV